VEAAWRHGWPGERRAYRGACPAAVVAAALANRYLRVLPIVLAGLAVLIALAGAGYVLVRARSAWRAGVGRSH
jgi:hypothetical protein